jgi:hypothetical protein
VTQVHGPSFFVFMPKGKSPTQSEKVKKNPGGNGGPRPGSGRKPGVLGIKARTLVEVKNRIAQKADDIINAELVEGLGAFVVMKADPETLEYKQVTDEKEIIQFIQEHRGANSRMGGMVYIIQARSGNYKSRQYLLDRAFGRPSQSVEVTTDPEIVKLKASIEMRAKEKGIDYAEELRNYVEHYAPAPIREKLASELVQ